MKLSIWLFGCAGLYIGILSPVDAATAKIPKLSVGSTRGFPGALSSIPIQYAWLTNLTAFQFDLVYDTNRALLGNYLLNSDLQKHQVIVREISPGVRRIVVFSSTNAVLTNVSTFANLPVRLPQTELSGSGALALQRVVFSETSGRKLDVRSLSGRVFVGPVDPPTEFGGAGFLIPAEDGQEYLLQASTNLIDWVDLETRIAEKGSVVGSDPEASQFRYRFYRAVVQGSSIAASQPQVPFARLQSLSLSSPNVGSGSFTLQASDDLKQWVDLEVGLSSGSQIQLTNYIDQRYIRRFYRLVRE